PDGDRDVELPGENGAHPLLPLRAPRRPMPARGAGNALGRGPRAADVRVPRGRSAARGAPLACLIDLDAGAPARIGCGLRDPHDYLRRTVPMLRAFRTALLAAAAAAALAAPAFAQAPIKIGVLTPLSPPGDAAAGQFIVRGAKMGAEEVNAQGGILGGRKIE